MSLLMSFLEKLMSFLKTNKTMPCPLEINACQIIKISSKGPNICIFGCVISGQKNILFLNIIIDFTLIASILQPKV